jgi:hypothetical protein
MKNQFFATAFVLASALVGASSFANTATVMQNSEAGAPATPYTVSSLTREQVRAQYLQALNDGTLPQYSEAGAAPMSSTVVAKSAAKAPTLAAAAVPGQLTRAQVRAEYFQALKEGTLVHHTEAGAPPMSSVQAAVTVSGHTQAGQ